jgi:deoxycytidine triphosphate deaminase
MDFSRLITRNQYEQVARAQGINPTRLSYKELEQLVERIYEERRKVYQQSKKVAA